MNLCYKVSEVRLNHPPVQIEFTKCTNSTAPCTPTSTTSRVLRRVDQLKKFGHNNVTVAYTSADFQPLGQALPVVTEEDAAGPVTAFSIDCSAPKAHSFTVERL